MSQPPVPFIQQVQAAFLRGDPLASGKHAELDNIAVLTDLYGHFLRGDLDAVIAGLDEEVDWQVDGPPTLPFAGCTRGRAQVRRLLEKGEAALERHDVVVEEVVAQGELVTVVAHERGRYQPTGQPYEGHWVQLFTIRSGKVAAFREFFDSAIFKTAGPFA
jgi:ketosteroid isomerase-like protein